MTNHPEFSRTIPVDKIDRKGQSQDIKADSAALAKRFDLLAVDMLNASVGNYARLGQVTFHVTGDLKANVTKNL